MRDLCLCAKTEIRLKIESERKKAEDALIKLHKFSLSFLEWVTRLTFEGRTTQRYNKGTNRSVRKARK